MGIAWRLRIDNDSILRRTVSVRMLARVSLSLGITYSLQIDVCHLLRRAPGIFPPRRVLVSLNSSPIVG
jgi:hypothetical protein